MLAWLVRVSLRAPAVVGLLAAALLLGGTFVLMKGKYDVFPEFVPPVGEIQTEAAGMVAEQVETLVTQPIERIVTSVPQVASVQSESIAGLSVVKVVFEQGSDVFRDRQLLAERLTEVAGHLPAGVETPTLSPLTSSTMDLLKFGVRSESLSPTQLRSFVDWTLSPRLQSVPGVAAVHVFGGAVRELHVVARPVDLAAHGIALEDLRQAVAGVLDQRGAGFIETASQRIQMQTSSHSPTADEIGAAVLTRREGGNVRVRDVAQVEEGAAPRYGDARVMGKPGVLVVLLSQYGSNTLEVTRRAEAALAEIAPTLREQGITLTPPTHRPATFTEVALANMKASLLVGALLVLVVLTLFLRDWRTAFISFVSIPLSLLAAVIVMQWWGWTINTMTLGGLAVAVGLVVDDAIIDVENIVRRLREALATGVATAPEAIVLAASLEVRRPVVLATVVVGLVFLPILMLGGLQGSFFSPMAAAFLLSIFASLLVALTVTPALCLVLLRDAGVRREPRWLRRLKIMQGRSIRVLRPHAAILLAGSLLLGVGAGWAMTRFGSELLPAFREGHYVIAIDAQAGTSLDEMMRLAESLDGQLLAIDGVQSLSHQAGRASGAEDSWPVNQSEVHLELAPGLDAAHQVRVEEQIRDVLSGYPGLQTEVLTFLDDRVGESLGGEASPVVVNLYGDDLGKLDELARQAAGLLRAMPDAGDVAPAGNVALPTMQVRLEPRQLALHGLRANEVLADIETAGIGSVVGQTYDGVQAVDVRVRLDSLAGRDPEDLAQLLVRSPAGRLVPLAEIAAMDLAGSRGAVLHDAGRRRQVIGMTPVTRDLEGFVQRARSVLESGLKLPRGYYLEFTGSAAGARAARAQLLWQSAAAAVGIILILAFFFPSPRSVLLILANVPFALTGGVLAAAVLGGVLSIGALVGFVALFGICARNTIMLLSHYEHLQFVEGVQWSRFAAWRGARERLIPILMTAAVTGLGLLPLALGGGEAGREIEAPMAAVILGGLLTSTLLNLFVLPVLAARYLPALRPTVMQ